MAVMKILILLQILTVYSKVNKDDYILSYKALDLPQGQKKQTNFKYCSKDTDCNDGKNSHSKCIEYSCQLFDNIERFNGTSFEKENLQQKRKLQYYSYNYNYYGYNYNYNYYYSYGYYNYYYSSYSNYYYNPSYYNSYYSGSQYNNSSTNYYGSSYQNRTYSYSYGTYLSGSYNSNYGVFYFYTSSKNAYYSSVYYYYGSDYSYAFYYNNTKAVDDTIDKAFIIWLILVIAVPIVSLILMILAITACCCLCRCCCMHRWCINSCCPCCCRERRENRIKRTQSGSQSSVHPIQKPKPVASLHDSNTSMVTLNTVMPTQQSQPYWNNVPIPNQPSVPLHIQPQSIFYPQPIIQPITQSIQQTMMANAQPLQTVGYQVQVQPQVYAPTSELRQQTTNDMGSSQINIKEVTNWLECSDDEDSQRKGHSSLDKNKKK